MADEDERRRHAERTAYGMMLGEAIVALEDRICETMLKCTDQRQAAVAILVDVCAYLDQAGASLEATQLLRGLAFQIDDLDNGNVGPLLEARKVSHRPSRPIREQMIAMQAALAMECEMHFGASKSTAAATVAKLLHASGIKIGRDGRPLTSVTVTKWRERLSEGPKNQEAASYAQARYPSALAKLGVLFVNPDAARRLIQELPALLAGFGNPTKPPS